MSNKVGVKTKHGHDSGELHSFQIHQYPKIRQYPIIRQILWKHSFIHSFIYLFCCCPKFQKFQKFQKFRKFHRKRSRGKLQNFCQIVESSCCLWSEFIYVFLTYSKFRKILPNILSKLSTFCRQDLKNFTG